MEPHELPPFRGLSRSALAAALGRFTDVWVEAGQPLMAEGEEDSSLVLVLEGELRIATGRMELGRAGPGEVIGETALLTGVPRTATVTAAVDTRLLVLNGADYAALRDAGSPVAASVEVYALELVVERLLDATRKVRALSKGTPLAEATPPKGFMARVRELLGTGGARAKPRIDIPATLRNLAFFGDVPDAALTEIAPHLDPQAWDAGTFLCTHGALGQEMYILLDGEVDVLVPTSEDKVEPLATLQPGDAFGMNALCTGGPRTASCVARTAVVVFSLGVDAWGSLVNANSPGGSALRVAMIGRVASQLAYANGELTLLERTKSTRNLGKASAALDSHGAYLD